MQNSLDGLWTDVRPKILASQQYADSLDGVFGQAGSTPFPECRSDRPSHFQTHRASLSSDPVCDSEQQEQREASPRSFSRKLLHKLLREASRSVSRKLPQKLLRQASRSVSRKLPEASPRSFSGKLLQRKLLVVPVRTHCYVLPEQYGVSATTIEILREQCARFREPT